MSDRARKEQWRAEVLRTQRARSIVCPTCSAGVDELCRSIHTGRVQMRNHAARDLTWRQLNRGSMNGR